MSETREKLSQSVHRLACAEARRDRLVAASAPQQVIDRETANIWRKVKAVRAIATQLDREMSPDPLRAA